MSVTQEILQDARVRLHERRTKIEQLLEPAQAELREIEKALKQLEDKRSHRPKSNGGGVVPADSSQGRTASKPPKADPPQHPNKQAVILRVLYQEDPERKGLSISAIAEAGNISGQGLHWVCRTLAGKGLVRQVGKGFWALAANAPAEEPT